MKDNESIDLKEKNEENEKSKVIEKYYLGRDLYKIINGKKYFYNLKNLYFTLFEREKDRKEIEILYNSIKEKNEIQLWYEEAKNKSCAWWIENHIIAKNSLNSCMNCGMCTSVCPAAEIYEFTPRIVMEIIIKKDEEEMQELLKSDFIWYCFQCGSCKTKCPRNNSPFGLISSLRQLSQLKGFHIYSVRGRQQYYARYLWGSNLWNRGCTIYFRNPTPENHKDFGERYKEVYRNYEEIFKQVNANPDMEGPYAGRKIDPETLEELRKLWIESGVLFFWKTIDEYAEKQATEWGLKIEEYLIKVSEEG